MHLVLLAFLFLTKSAIIIAINNNVDSTSAQDDKTANASSCANVRTIVQMLDQKKITSTDDIIIALSRMSAQDFAHVLDCYKYAHDNADDNNNNNNNIFSIPKKIHQIWIGPKPIPDQTRSFDFACPSPTSSCAKKGLDENNNNIDDNVPSFDTCPVQECEHIIHQSTPPEAISADLLSYERNDFVMSADIARLEILYEHGGLYIDADSEWLGHRSLAELFEDDQVLKTGFFLSAEPRRFDNEHLFATGVIGASPRHPITLYLIAKLRSAFLPCRVQQKHPAWICTGPLLYTKVLDNEFLMPRLVEFPSSFFYPVNWREANRKTFDKSAYPLSYTVDYGYTTNQELEEKDEL